MSGRLMLFLFVTGDKTANAKTLLFTVFLLRTVFMVVDSYYDYSLQSFLNKINYGIGISIVLTS